MKRLSEIECQIPVNVRPEILRLTPSMPPKVEISCCMPFWSLHFFSNHANINIHGKWVTVKPGEAFLTPPDTHTVSRYPGGHSLVFAHFYLPESSKTRKSTAPVHVLLESSHAHILAVMHEGARDFKVNPRKGELALWYILNSLYSGSSLEQEEKNETVSRRVAAALKIVEENLSGIAGVEDVASRLGCSTRHLNRQFRDAFGITVSEHIREQRMLMARRYLRDTDYLVKEICALVGIPDPHHFNHMIRKRFGKAPGELRNRK